MNIGAMIDDAVYVLDEVYGKSAFHPALAVESIVAYNKGLVDLEFVDSPADEVKEAIWNVYAGGGTAQRTAERIVTAWERL